MFSTNEYETLFFEPHTLETLKESLENFKHLTPETENGWVQQVTHNASENFTLKDLVISQKHIGGAYEIVFRTRRLDEDLLQLFVDHKTGNVASSLLRTLPWNAVLYELATKAEASERLKLFKATPRAWGMLETFQRENEPELLAEALVHSNVRYGNYVDFIWESENVNATTKLIVADKFIPQKRNVETLAKNGTSVQARTIMLATNTYEPCLVDKVVSENDVHSASTIIESLGFNQKLAKLVENSTPALAAKACIPSLTNFKEIIRLARTCEDPILKKSLEDLLVN